MIKDHAGTDPSGFLKIDIPRFPEPAFPHEDTGPATAERLGLDRRQMRDTIACFDGKGCLDLISLSSRRRGRYIAHLPAVRAGGRDCLLLISIFFVGIPYWMGPVYYTSGCTLHPYTENSFLVGACLRTSGCTLHPYRENFFLVGAYLDTSA